MSYPYSLPTTGAISLADAFKDAGSYSSELTEATARRGQVRTHLKELKKDGQSTRNYAPVINAIDGYLPYLVSIINCVEAEIFQPSKNFETSWRSTLSVHIIHKGSNAPRIPCEGLYGELIFVLLTYAYALSLRGTDDLTAALDGHPNAAMLFNKTSDAFNSAASIFAFVAYNVIPKYRDAATQHPLETLEELSAGLSKMALADAQAVAICKALATSQISKSLVAKLYVGVSEEYDKAFGLLSAIKHSPGVSLEIRKYLSDGTLFYRAMAKIYLARDEHEQNGMGNAVGFLESAKADLRSLQQTQLSKPHLRKSSFAARADREEEMVNDMLKQFRLLNDKVGYDRVPTPEELVHKIPNGRSVTELKGYQLPKPAFGPSEDDNKTASHYARSGSYY